MSRNGKGTKMKMGKDGNLILYASDLKTFPYVSALLETPELGKDFREDAEIAAHYATMAGYKVSFIPLTGEETILNGYISAEDLDSTGGHIS